MSSVSVVIPCYRYGHFLESAVSSVLDDQDGVDVRVLIIDDASPDDSVSVARELAARHDRVELVVHEVNQGNIATFNEGLLEWADGDYCMLLSADDRATPGALARATALLDAHPEVGMVYGRALWFEDGAPLPTVHTRVRGWSVFSGQEWLEHRFRQAENPVITPEVVARTSLQQRVGGYDPELPKAADMELFMRLAAHAHVGFIRGADQALYRRHGTNMSASVSALMDLRQRRSVFEVVLERYGDRLVNTDRMSDDVHRQLGREALWAAGRVYDRGRLRESDLGRRLMGGGTHESEQDVDELLAFAADCWPDATGTRLYGALEAGRRLSPLELQYLLNQKAQWWLRRRSWRYRGY
jgi:glycosyltransferase involved in cell wall biosynthesis